MTNKKPFYKSQNFWVAVFTIAILIANYLGFSVSEGQADTLAVLVVQLVNSGFQLSKKKDVQPIE